MARYPGCGCRTCRVWTAARGCRSWWGAPRRCSPADTSGCGTLWRAHWAGWSLPAASRRRAAARRAALRSLWPCGRWRRGWGAGASARWHCVPPLSWCQSQAELWALQRQRTQSKLRSAAASRPVVSHRRPQGSFHKFDSLASLSDTWWRSSVASRAFQVGTKPEAGYILIFLCVATVPSVPSVSFPELNLVVTLHEICWKLFFFFFISFYFCSICLFSLFFPHLLCF